MFGIGETELVIIVVFAFMLFGPDKLPGMGRTLGRVLRQFREASDGFTEVVQTNIMDPASEELEKSPKQRRREAAELAGEDANVDSAASEAGEEQATAAPARRETFAERKARLAAERAAREQEASAADDVQELEGGEATSAEHVEAPARTSAADLYATTQHSSRFSARDEADERDDAPESTNGEEDGSVED
ncbi:MAG: twin-arginine translocase TatA/TatE family subunit [Atopobiaceae bacterium]|nr:twin-arginine translocase TatA/TatE family subunit [Atopobiaceae bacterium]